MPHQHPDAANAAVQNTVGDRQQPNDMAREEHASIRPEPRSYAAPDVEDSTLAAPAAGEMPDYIDEGDPSYGAQQGANHTNWELHRDRQYQGPKTAHANRQIAKGRTP